MKKLLFFAILLLVAGEVSAQRRYARRPPPPRHQQRNNYYDDNRVTVSIIGGANITNLVSSYSRDFNYNSIAGVHAGLSVDIPIDDQLFITPEIMFSQKGYSAVTPDGEFRQRNNFIDVPVFLKFKLSRSFSLMAGPQVSFLTSSRNSFNNGFVTIVDGYNYRDNYNYTGNDVLLGGVLGINIGLSRNVELRARYSLDQFINDDDPYAYIPRYRNQVFQVGLGIKLR
ncbi:hypothetical protein GCM10023149_41710 [Mucilaginibacter gynuensis]|uniref:Outer membrane protein beta-barrel domain-containing protein n=1 Tax=Mucilaginibacter gynuensis TaxID=1302236 RepID=A0ABP8H5B0_9SPHI